VIGRRGRRKSPADSWSEVRICVGEGLVTDHVGAGVQRLPDKPGGVLGTEVHLVAVPSLHLVKRRDRRDLSSIHAAAITDRICRVR